MTDFSDKIEIHIGDITKLEVDAIVNAANSALLGGGGVDGAIHRAGGQAILEDCRKIIAKQGSCATGQAVITTAGNLPAKFVIHTVGPIWYGGNNYERQSLENCYKNSLGLGQAYKCKSMSFPNISTGIYRFPKDEAAKIAIETVHTYLSKENSFEKILFVCFEEENFWLLNEYLKLITSK